MTLVFYSDSRRGAAVAHTRREGDVRLTSCCRCLALLAVFGLLALTELASAEGAWTMWMIGTSSPWDSVGEIRGQCLPNTVDRTGRRDDRAIAERIPRRTNIR